MTDAPLYDFSIVPFVRSIKNLLAIFAKAEQYAKENNENVEDYIKLQLHPNMKGFGYQIQRISDTSKFVLVRIAGVDSESVAMADDEKTWADFKSRLERTVTVLEAAKPEDFVGKEGTEVPLFGGKYLLTGKSYLQQFAIPNFYFHVTTAYDLLRAKGVPIGKLDYISRSAN